MIELDEKMKRGEDKEPELKATKCKAFTLAELLITLGIIGIVAVLIIATFIKNYQEKAWKTSAEVFDKKLTEAINLMNTNDELAGYTTTENFVDKLSKYTKIIKTCNESNLDNCWIKGESTIGGEITLQRCPASGSTNIKSTKAVRTCTGLGLGDANNVIKNVCAGIPQTIACTDKAAIATLESEGVTINNEIYDLKNLEFNNYVNSTLYYANNLIEKLGSSAAAIKFVRKCTGLTLKEAKALVDSGTIYCNDTDDPILSSLEPITTQKAKAETSIIGIVFADGAQALIIYNPNCTKQDLSHSECIGIVYDISGFRTPNYIGKDRGLLVK